MTVKELIYELQRCEPEMHVHMICEKELQYEEVDTVLELKGTTVLSDSSGYIDGVYLRT